jgi:amino acid transporter
VKPPEFFTHAIPATDEQRLARFGYRQELRRTLGSFSSFAVTFSIVSVTTGLFANYGNGLKAAGPAFVWTWPIVGAGQLLVALVFARLAREIPLAGYSYHWARHLAGPRWGWWAGWMFILQFLTGMPGVCYALATYLAPYLGIGAANRNVLLLTIAGLVVIALINHLGIRMASGWNEFTVLAEIGGSGLAGLLLLAVALHRQTHTWGFLFTHPGHPSGLPYLGAFAFSSLMSAWTITGFEQAANLAEETHQPHHRVPRIIVLSLVLGVVLGFLVLLGFTLAIPALGQVEDHPTPLLFIIGQHFPPWMTNIEMSLVFVAMFGSALANITTLTRMVWSMARDHQLPGSLWLARVSARQVPANAIWTVTVLSSLFVLWAKFEAIITGIATLAGYATYAIVVAATLRRGEVKSQKSEARSTASVVDRPGSVTSDDRQSTKDNGPGTERRSRALNVAALIWIIGLLGMLGLPRSAWTNSLAMLMAVAAGGLWYKLRISDVVFERRAGS